MINTAPATILLAEDDEGHATLVQRNLRRAGVVNDIVWVKDGQEALDYVHSTNAYTGRAHDHPLVMLLDINMPRMGGVEVLRQLKSDERTRTIPTVMLTTTDDPREVANCYELGCGIYITKPVEYEVFCDVVRRLGMFLQIAVVPNERIPIEQPAA
ncbi:MAG: response regulator [Gammaproteobacteria bacterium]|nr:response regulator [Gammaproteobacteria bacterium]